MTTRPTAPRQDDPMKALVKAGHDRMNEATRRHESGAEPLPGSPYFVIYPDDEVPVWAKELTWSVGDTPVGRLVLDQTGMAIYRIDGGYPGDTSFLGGGLRQISYEPHVSYNTAYSTAFRMSHDFTKAIVTDTAGDLNCRAIGCYIELGWYEDDQIPTRQSIDPDTAATSKATTAPASAPRMRAGEFAALVDSLGIDRVSYARVLEVSDRTVRRWIEGVMPVSVDVATRTRALCSATRELVDDLVASVETGSLDPEDHDQADAYWRSLAPVAGIDPRFHSPKRWWPATVGHVITCRGPKILR